MSKSSNDNNEIGQQLVVEESKYQSSKPKNVQENFEVYKKIISKL